MRRHDPARDNALADLLHQSGAAASIGLRDLTDLSARICAAAASELGARAAGQTIWDYAERWAGLLIPCGALTALAAGLCLFVASTRRNPDVFPAPRIALLGAATNRMSSQNLLDLLVTTEVAPGARVRGSR